ncbi:MAG: hypothetical protein A2086_13890 [Spirochaetes bacterium GWD1_27_9]|nr:MAG: hypothetical protein A2Z98_14325 [Spirochaetes bacterium GWB1_27_13]OHD22272.1 MAG: hypothetical protein A2Y34_06100 [Spirochaetes bacterium GWC1_27_15]OHD44088.1 MAG: hypothetical protein A2086_13890 [Spirochaetes bacterium GWD1_27_9]
MQKRFTIAFKLFLSFSIIIFLIVLLFSIIIINLQYLDKSLKLSIEQDIKTKINRDVNLKFHDIQQLVIKASLIRNKEILYQSKLLIDDMDEQVNQLIEKDEANKDKYQEIIILNSKLWNISKKMFDGFESDYYDGMMSIEHYDLLFEKMSSDIELILANEEKKLDNSIEEIKKANRNIFVITLIIGLMVILICITTSFFLTNNIRKLLKAITDSTKQLASGEGDLTKLIEIKNNDEISDLSNNFNSFILTLNTMIKNINFAIDKAYHVSINLASTSEESSASLEEINASIENINKRTIFLDNEINKSDILLKDIKSFVLNVSDLIYKQSTDIKETSQFLEEITTSVKNITNTTDKKIEITRNLEKLAEDGEKFMEENIKIIKNVGNSVKIIMDLLTVINNITAQTNLLSMNAAIEASHAGEYGKGFAVVADEIRKLSETTSLNAKEITKSLKEAVNNIQISEQSTQKMGDIFKKTTFGIKEVSLSMEEMKNFINELSGGSKQIILSLTSLINTSEDIKKSGDKMVNKVDEIDTSLTVITKISKETKEGMEEITLGTNEIYKAVQLVSESGIHNSENVGDIEEMVKRFKIS